VSLDTVGAVGPVDIIMGEGAVRRIVVHAWPFVAEELETAIE
jgi:hypothetical protein